MYKQAIQEIKLAGCRGGLILCSEGDPGNVLVLLEWESNIIFAGAALHLTLAFAPPSKVGKSSQALADIISQRRFKDRRDLSRRLTRRSLGADRAAPARFL